MRLDRALDNSIQIDPTKSYASADDQRPKLGGVQRRMNDLSSYRDIFANLEPWSGYGTRGLYRRLHGDLDTLEASFWIGHDLIADKVGSNGASWPALGDGQNGESWFEAANWIVAAREARDRFVMITLGAYYGAQAVGAYRAVQMSNPMPCKLVLVEPEPDNCKWIERHMRDNGIDPDDHWLVPLAISDKTDPVLFPVGSPGPAHKIVTPPTKPSHEKSTPTN